MQITALENPGLRVNASMFSCPFQPNEVPNFQIFSTTNLITSTTKEEYNGSKKISYTNEPWRQISDFQLIPGGNYILIPSTLEAGVFGIFNILKSSNLLGKYRVKLFSSSKLLLKEYHVFKE